MAATTSVSRSQRRSAALFVAPFFALFGFFTVAPIGYAVWQSLFSEQRSGLGFGEPETLFVGIDNFTRALGDRAFRAGFANIAGYVIVYIPLLVGIALLLALLLDSAVARARRFVQISLYLPNIAPGLIAALIWVYLYTPGLSPVVDLLGRIGVPWDLSSGSAATGALVNVALWSHTGFNVIIFYAALQAIPREVLEAATMDGAGGTHTALRIKTPMIRAAVVLAALFTVVGAVQLFTEPMLLRSRATSIDSSWTPTMYIVEAAFARHDYGLAAAASVLLAAVIAVASYLVTRLDRRSAA